MPTEEFCSLLLLNKWFWGIESIRRSSLARFHQLEISTQTSAIE